MNKFPRTAWIAGNKNEMDKLHFFRHAVPEAVNLKIDNRRKKDPYLGCNKRNA